MVRGLDNEGPVLRAADHHLRIGLCPPQTWRRRRRPELDAETRQNVSSLSPVDQSSDHVSVSHGSLVVLRIPAYTVFII